jgi:hypothetical protein
LATRLLTAVLIAWVCSPLTARAGCEAERASFDALINHFNTKITPRVTCDNIESIFRNEVVPLFSKLASIERALRQCSGVSWPEVSQSRARITEQKATFARQCAGAAKDQKNPAQAAQATQDAKDAKQISESERHFRGAAADERRKANLAPFRTFDCARKRVGDGAAWDLECLEDRRSAAHPPRTGIPSQVLSNRATAACQQAPGEAKQRCIIAAKTRILMTEDARIRRVCGGFTGDALVTCVDGAYAGDARSAALRAKLSDRLRQAAPGQDAAELPSQPAVASTWRDKLSSLLPGSKQRDDPNEAYCSFVAHRVRRSDLAYSRAEQIPAECKGSDDVKQALADQKVARPMLDLDAEQDAADRKRLKREVDSIEALWKDGKLRDQLPP